MNPDDLIKSGDEVFVEDLKQKMKSLLENGYAENTAWGGILPPPDEIVDARTLKPNLTITSTKPISHGIKITDSIHDTSGSIIFRDNLLSICNKKGEELIVFDIETGKIEFPSTLNFEEAARIFWGAVALVMHQHMIPATRVKEERERQERDYLALLDELKDLREELQKKNQLINKLLLELKRMEEMNNGESNSV